jgi:hypothetical protein
MEFEKNKNRATRLKKNRHLDKREKSFKMKRLDAKKEKWSGKYDLDEGSILGQVIRSMNKAEPIVEDEHAEELISDLGEGRVDADEDILSALFCYFVDHNVDGKTPLEEKLDFDIPSFLKEQGYKGSDELTTDSLNPEAKEIYDTLSYDSDALGDDEGESEEDGEDMFGDDEMDSDDEMASIDSDDMDDETGEDFDALDGEEDDSDFDLDDYDETEDDDNEDEDDFRRYARRF